MIPADHSLWKGVVEEFRDHYHMVSITTPDMELSTGLRKKWGYRIQEIVEMIETFLTKHLGTTRQFDLLMHDWGCLWGFKYTEKNPGRLRKIVALGSSLTNSMRGHKSRIRIHVLIGQQVFVMLHQWLSLATSQVRRGQ